MTPPPFVAHNAPLRVALLLALSLGFVALGAWCVGLLGTPPDDDIVTQWVGWACILFFGACALVAVPRLTDRSEVMRIDGSGIRWTQWSDDIIPWSQVTGVQVLTIQRQKMVGLTLRDRTMFPSRKLLGRLAAANRMFGADIYLTVAGTDRRYADLEAAVIQFTPHLR